jgi:tRNA (Thr-GGU) A37 N-methylase
LEAIDGTPIIDIKPVLERSGDSCRPAARRSSSEISSIRTKAWNSLAPGM